MKQYHVQVSNRPLLTPGSFKREHIVLFQILPLIIHIYNMHSVIEITLKRQDKVLIKTPNSDPLRNRRKQRAINKVTLCTVAAFYICCLPFHTVTVMWEFGVDMKCTFARTLWFIVSVLLYLSLTVNPVIFFVFIKNYRNGLKQIFKSCRRQKLKTDNMENIETCSEGILT